MPQAPASTGSVTSLPANSEPQQVAQAGGGNAGGAGAGIGVGGGPGYVSYGGLLGGGVSIPPANPNANDQTGKQGFLAQPGSTGSDDYLNATHPAPEIAL